MIGFNLAVSISRFFAGFLQVRGEHYGLPWRGYCA